MPDNKHITHPTDAQRIDTTDITRMVAIGSPSQAQREDCTSVLQGMIALSRTRFPEGLFGF